MDPAAAAMPSGTVTFLFTDLESSTRLWLEHPDAMPGALARHDELVGEAITRHGGRVVKTTGDGFHAAFGAAHDAVAAAVTAQLALAAEDWAVPLRVRMGIHTGPAELRDGDYYGTAVNRAARLMSVAHGGQVVVSLATRELVPDGAVELVDLGEHTLRDLSRPDRIFQVVHPDLPRDFPHLATLDAFGGNLPVQVTSFVGRDEDLARVEELLDDAALVTLIGTGGVGKTRLALQVAAEMLPRFRDGAWFCELAPIDDAEGLAQVVATTLGCVQRPGLSLAESVVEFVKVRTLLLVLDNCEHLVDDAAALAAAVLRTCPDVRVIATSREALDVTGERVVRVRSLDAPDPGAARDALVHSTAVRLFADRAADAGAVVAWTDAQWRAIGEICRRVDGIPLAIELAAARVTAMSPTDIAAHLDERFRLLTGKRRGRVERHQTLRATVEWSYQLLDDDERAVFDRLGVFPATFDAAAAVAVVGDEHLHDWTVIEAIGSLVAKSMLLADEGPDGAARYSMLETLRQYARETLDETGDADRWRRRHAEHFAAWARDAGFGLVGPDAALWIARIRADLDNVRAAVEWALDSGSRADQELGVAAVAWLAELANIDTESGLGALAMRALPFAETCGDEERVPVLTAAAYHVMNQGDVARARELARAAVSDGIVLDAASPANAFQILVYIELLLGDHAAIIAAGDQARRAVEAVGSDYHIGRLLGALACYEGINGQVDLARADAAEAMRAARRTGNVISLGNAHHGTAWAEMRDDPAAALAAAEAHLDIYRRHSVMKGSAGSVLALAGGLRARLGDLDGALALLREAVEVSRDQGVRPQLAVTLGWSLAPLARTGASAAAATFVGALDAGPLAGMGDFPGVADARVRFLDRVRATLGDVQTDRCLDRGAAMTYDEIVAYALEHLTPASA